MYHTDLEKIFLPRRICQEKLTESLTNQIILKPLKLMNQFPKSDQAQKVNSSPKLEVGGQNKDSPWNRVFCCSQRDLVAFVLSCTSKYLNDFIENTREKENAKA